MNKYAHLRPGADNRSCTRDDGGPKRKLNYDQALADEARNPDCVAYGCFECGYWHLGHRRRPDHE